MGGRAGGGAPQGAAGNSPFHRTFPIVHHPHVSSRGPFSFFPASPPSTISRDLAQNIADRVGAILGLRLVVGEGKAAKGDYSKYRKPPPGIERSGTPRPGAPLVWQKVIELLRYEDHLLETKPTPSCAVLLEFGLAMRC
ncbi:hypothetical protein AB1E18_015180 [Capra hircus]